MGGSPSRLNSAAGSHSSSKQTRNYDAPAGTPIFRHDNVDRDLIKSVLQAEEARLKASAQMGAAAADAYMDAFSAGVWKAFVKLSLLQISEDVAYNKKASADPDHWFEINTANAVLFDNLTLLGMAEVLPGRLFTTRMPRNISSDPAAAAAFRDKVQAHSLHTVLILTETEEYQQYAKGDLEEFYRSIGLEIIHRPIHDFSLPIQADMILNVKDLTWRLAEGNNCLVHCAGGNGRTGMVIAGVFKHVGIKDPISWIRRVKTTYVETPEQEHFVNAMPMVLDPRICAKHPTLERAIAAEYIIDVLLNSPYPRTAASAGALVLHTPEQESGCAAVFELIDTKKSGTIALADMEALLRSFNADVSYAKLGEFFKGVPNGRIDKDMFVELFCAKWVQ